MHEAKQRKYFKKQIARIMQTQFNALQVRIFGLHEVDKGCWENRKVGKFYVGKPDLRNWMIPTFNGSNVILSILILEIKI